MLLHDVFDFHAVGRRENCFAEFEGHSLTYGEAWNRSGKMAVAIRAAGLRPGDRLCLVMQNSTDFILLVFAASQAGVVFTPLNYRLTPSECAALIVDSGAKLLIADPHYCDAMNQVLDGGDVVPSIMRVCSGQAADKWIGLEDWIDEARELEPGSNHRADPEDILLQMYTSGTTGFPKGALLSHRCILANLSNLAVSMPCKVSPGETVLTVLPLFHAAALSTSLSAIFYGASLIIHRNVDPAAIVKSLANDRVALISLVPAIIQFILDGVAGLEEMHFSHLRCVAYGASPIAGSVLTRALNVLNCDFTQGLGMTELAGACTMLTEADHRLALAQRPELLLSAGRAMPGVRLRIVDEDGIDLRNGKVGEVLVSSTQLFSGYWNRPEDTAQAFAGGWFRTGDAGYLDDQGYLFICDRIKDVIISGGENVYPAEIEKVLQAHPAISEAAVIGVPDPRWGETVMAVLVRRADQGVTEGDLDRHCRASLAGFKVPRRYDFSSGLPRNATGKILKRELRLKYPAEPA